MPSEEPVEHLVRQGRGARVLRWLVVGFGTYNVLVHAVEGRFWLALAWAAVTGALLAVQLAPRRLGTRVEGDGLRVGSGTRWGRLITWDQVERLRPQGPYDRASALVLRDGHRLLLLRGMDAAAVRALASSRGLPLEEPGQRRLPARPRGAGSGGAPVAAPPPGGAPAGPVDPLDDGPLDGPFRASRRSG
ncbi:hypothetical protein FHN55_19175 [Streptomyces sp. NP160]|uniref:hypothetical protein n=1 Tax=Streptomyces sp. NP160 TaxID=2586637 RepID=UPI0011182173|nr:hypothetical protein [Streptomyces sp. NP160]TNM59933.1 hypothetical protein FHN55_19175 [Streptomyces sp. NP160]